MIKIWSNKLFAKYSLLQKFLIILFMVITLLLNVLSIYNKSLMYDEICFIGTGKYILKTGNFVDYDGWSHHPPFSLYLNSIFLLPLKFKDDVYEKNLCREVGSGMIFYSGYSPYLITFLARLPFIILSVILSLFVLKFSENLYGTKSALLAMFLYTFSTSILSNSGFVLPDFAATFSVFTTIYFFHRLMNNTNTKNLFLTGIFFGLALLSKMTSLMVVVFIIIFFILEYLRNKNPYAKNIPQILKLLSVIVIIGFFVVWLAYGFTINTIKGSMQQHYIDRAYQEFDKTFKNDFTKKIAIHIFEKTYFPAPAYLYGLAGIWYRSVDEGREGYFFGGVLEKAPWYYQFVVFILKTQISLIILLVLTIVIFRKIKHKITINELYITIPILILSLGLTLSKLASGLNILPVYPFLFVFVSKLTKLRRNAFKILLVLMIAHYMLSSILAFPNYYAYFNEFVGGSINGYKYLGDGNIDNGQSLPQLKEFMTSHDIKKINLSYLGSVDPKQYGIDYDYMPSPYFQYWVPGFEPYIKPDKAKEKVRENCSKRKGWVAVSASNYQGVYLLNRTCYSWLKNYEPVERIAYSIFVYNITS